MAAETRTAEQQIIESLMQTKDVKRQLGYPAAYDDESSANRGDIALVLATHGVFIPHANSALDVAKDLIQNYREKVRLLANNVPPVAQRIQSFLEEHLKDVTDEPIRFPADALVLSKHGIARALSFPIGKDSYEAELVTSYRVAQGVLHNPRSDKRTTQGSFHIAEGGLPIAADKYRVPKGVFARMLREALNPPRASNVLPFTAGSDFEAPVMASLLVRPIVCPEIPGHAPQKTMEVYALAPGGLVCNLDFVESVFGNAGDPFLPENDSALDVEHWTGHTGCLILAPHLTKLKKKDLGLPHVDQATPLQKEQGMCWATPEELYNDGRAFKCTCRTDAGVVITVIADNYFGYCKKEVKTQLSYAANLMGLAEEEHAGGTLAFPRYNYGMAMDYPSESSRWHHLSGYSFPEAMRLLGSAVDVKPEGYAVDKAFPNIFYVPEAAKFSLATSTVTWGTTTIKLAPGNVYVLPSGYKIHVEHHPAAPAWRIIGTEGRGVFLHKPCTVSGGGKSELSKSIAGSMMYGPLFINDPVKDLNSVDEILNHDYSTRFRRAEGTPELPKDTRPLLSDKRSLGSVIKLLTPAKIYTDEYNAWLNSFPAHIWPIVFYVKRFYKSEWGSEWRSHFSMDLINGGPGHELKFNQRKIMAGFVRIGFNESGMWRTYKTRIDFIPSAKVQMEDDISTSVTVPLGWLPSVAAPADGNLSDDETRAKARSRGSKPVAKKLITNCEFRLFQRPDDCIHRGVDEQAEFDLAQPGNFIANFEPLRPRHAKEFLEDVVNFENFSAPMKDFIRTCATKREDSYLVSSAHTRIVQGKPTNNPRYLQVRPDAVCPVETYVARIGQRLSQRLAADVPVVNAVDVTMLGRRISKPGPGLPNLCVYNPIHYQELPELIMDIICSVSGTSPSTTGAGSEGALTKGPFNCMPFTADLNNLFASYALTGLGGWSTPTGYVGPKGQFAHDVSFLAPEIWCRMKAHERDPAWLIENGYLEKVQDFEFQGRKVLASRLGYRITDRFADFFGRVFDFPNVFEEQMLKPELQDMASFVDGVDSVVTVQKVIGQRYFDDGTVEMFCPPLKALLHIMVHGKDQAGRTIDNPEFRAMFARENVLKSKWYHERLLCQQRRDVALWSRHVATIEAYLADPRNAAPAKKLALDQKLAFAKQQLAAVSAPAYVESLFGSIGADPFAPHGEK